MSNKNAPQNTLKADFIHLHTHSHYSLLNALPTPKELVQRAKEYDMPALALTDNGGLYGAINFYKACTKENIKPIIGIDTHLAPRTRFDKDAGIDKPRGQVIFLAKNNEGYKNLIKMVTESYVHGFYYRPRVDHDLISKLHDSLICIIPSFSGEPVLALKDSAHEQAEATLDWYKGIFGDDCYLEITHHPEIKDHEELQKNIIDLGIKTNTKLVAAHDVYYLNQSDYLARETMIKIQSGGVVETQDTEGELAPNFSFISQEKAKELFHTDIERQALKHSVEIASECTVEMSLGSTWYFPDYKIKSGKEPDTELTDTAYAGVAWRGLSLDDPIVKERLDYELGVIKMKGYAKYFLVVGDLIREARERKILTTIRGSVAGSLTTYVLGITNVDPLEYKLPFERFLNPERPSAPDIDMDYADNRRDEIIDYARAMYGTDNVAQIGTFGTMMARAAVRDVARALGHPYSTGDRIAKLIPIGSQGFPMTIEKALEIEPDLKELYKKDPDTKEVIDLAKQIEGRVRHVGVHAAGVVIAPQALTEFVPLQPDPKSGKLITQYEMHSVGEDGVGLLKFDFLGIKNLSILAEAVRRVRIIHGVEVDIEKIHVDDIKTFEMLARGETMGLFQLNGTGMTAFLKQLRPTSIHDINAMVALYRPGPMESIPQYIERKHNASLITYIDPRLEKILDRSYGVITYQDDVMMIARELAGYSWLEADMLRKAMGKKIPAVMEAEKEKLLKGFTEHGKLSSAHADKLWKLIEPFAAYGFNKAHAASYGRVAYQTAYMKANYPVEYMSAVLTADAGDTEKISEIIHECVRMDIEVLPPDINESFGPFSVVPAKDKVNAEGREGALGYEVNAKIRFGLTTIKNFGEGIAESIIDERKENGPYQSLQDFLSRVTSKNLNKKSLEALIMSGSFDCFEERGTMMHNLETILAYHKEHLHGKESAQDSLFGNLAGSSVLTLTLEPGAPAAKGEKLLWEKELLGVYVSGHPLDAFKEELAKRPRIGVLKKETRNGIPVVTAGMIETVRELLTKKGDRMAFVILSDGIENIELVAFPEIYRAHQSLLIPGSCVALQGKLSMRNEEPTIVIERLKDLTPKELTTE
ncbi:MAG: DNA polymerase III subunit alpha [Candidatus Pacebacteria bacterium]|nr:DNA polymerase III subunit alpha [Candidatus Paceibacterota bacterium]MCF7857003.1 DNA polymerase III subunit alpha [Candidatus Paceibacterota bacterium]